MVKVRLDEEGDGGSKGAGNPSKSIPQELGLKAKQVEYPLGAFLLHSTQCITGAVGL